MASRFTFGRITAFALLAGLAAGAATASYTLSRANFAGTGGDTGADSYARFSGNVDAAGAARNGASRCPGCRDSYDMVYLDDPRRTRSKVRVGRGDPVGGLASDDVEYAESLDRPPPETGWGVKRQREAERPRTPSLGPFSYEDTTLAQQAAERDARMGSAARQIERTVVQTATMNDPVTIHRPASRPTQNADPSAVGAAQPVTDPRPGG